MSLICSISSVLLVGYSSGGTQREDENVVQIQGKLRVEIKIIRFNHHSDKMRNSAKIIWDFQEKMSKKQFDNFVGLDTCCLLLSSII